MHTKSRSMILFLSASLCLGLISQVLKANAHDKNSKKKTDKTEEEIHLKQVKDPMA